MKTVGLAINDRGCALVSVEEPDPVVTRVRDLSYGDVEPVGQPRRELLVTGIERLPFDLGVVDRRVRELPADRYIIDAEGLGSALWPALGTPRTRRVGDEGWSFV